MMEEIKVKIKDLIKSSVDTANQYIHSGQTLNPNSISYREASSMFREQLRLLKKQTELLEKIERNLRNSSTYIA